MSIEKICSRGIDKDRMDYYIYFTVLYSLYKQYKVIRGYTGSSIV